MSLVSELVVPKEYGYVLLAGAATCLVAIWHGARVTSVRRKAGIKYPQPYAEQTDFTQAKTSEQKDALYLFNCAQRAHGNFQENYPIVAVCSFVAGLQYPRTSAALTLGWAVSRVLFALGYSNIKAKNGSGRYRGATFWLFQLGLVGLVGYMGVQSLL